MEGCEEVISKEAIQRQAWKFYLVTAAWPAYLFVLPFFYARFGPASVVFMLFPGVYLFIWMQCLMHECWHKYVPSVNIRFFYDLFSYMSLADPQIYRLLHSYHHSKVNTWDIFPQDCRCRKIRSIFH